MYPHERSLVKRLEDKPFALIGVNSDSDRDEIRKAQTKLGITWRSFWISSFNSPVNTAISPRCGVRIAGAKSFLFQSLIWAR